MAEPEDVILDSAYHATLAVRRLWGRNSKERAEDELALSIVRGRLEFFVGAVFGQELGIIPADAPISPNLFARLGKRIPRHLIERRYLASTDGIRLRLPPSLLPRAGFSAGEIYRMIVSQVAARAVRGTCQFLPRDLLARDLYLINEAAAIDRELATLLPGLRRVLEAATAKALAERPERRLLTEKERLVEDELLKVLKSETSDLSQTPEDSLKWAKEKARAINDLAGAYRGLAAVDFWGRVDPPPAAGKVTTSGGSEDSTPGTARVGRMKRRPQVREAGEDEDDETPGIWMIQTDDPQEHVEDPMGLQRPTDRDDEANEGDLADSLSELPEARLVTSPGSPKEILASDDPPPAGRAEITRGKITKGFFYPEWDYRCGGYLEKGALVRERVAREGDPEWAAAVLRRRAALLNEVQRRFERLRPRRQVLNRQTDGAEIDLVAFVESHADRRAGCPADERLYRAVRPARRDVAISLLVDISGSTDGWVSENLRIIDVEKEALLVVTSALEALGDPYSIQAFSGEGPEAVSMLTLKDFSETSKAKVHRRIAALEPERFTRMGAAIRHATAKLMARPAEHRLLLLLSDGKPNDMDHYEGRYGVEDSRQAVAEARLQRIHPFCVTVDRSAPSYMPRIFGAGGYAALHHPEHLPKVLVDILKRLVKA